MCDYDREMLTSAKAVLDYLKTQPDFRWWNRWIKRPKSLKEAGAERLDLNGYSLFLGWDSFTCRNGSHELSRALYWEFRRVFGRPATLFD